MSSSLFSSGSVACWNMDFGCVLLHTHIQKYHCHVLVPFSNQLPSMKSQFVHTAAESYTIFLFVW